MDEKAKKARGEELRKARYMSRFDWYEFMGFNDPAMRPESWTCEGCPQWDDVNGCWDNCRSIMQCKRMGEEPHYVDPDMVEDDHDADWMYEDDAKGSWHPEPGDTNNK